MPDCRKGRVVCFARVLILAAPIAFLATFSQSAELTVRDLTQTLRDPKITQPDLTGRDLRFLDLSELDFKAAKLGDADLFGVDLTGSKLAGADMANVRLDRAILVRADFSDAVLEGATLLRPSAYATHEFVRKDAPRFQRANLKGARITGRLDGTNFAGADLSDADFGPHERGGADTSVPRSLLNGCDFSGSRAAGANFSRAQLSFSSFVGADLSGARFEGADLSKVDFTGANLSGADLTGADLYGAILTGAKGIETAIGLASVLNRDKAVE